MLLTLVGLLAIGCVVFVIGALLWGAFSSSGEMAAVTSLDPEDAVSNAISGFAANGWDAKIDRHAFAVLKKGPDGCTSLLLLVLIFPVGLVYLLTDWGQSQITVRATEGEDVTHVLIQWRNASVRGEVQGLVDWLATQRGSRRRR